MEKSIRAKLKKCQPYFIEKDLIDKLNFKDDENNTEYWIFKYVFITGLSDLAIAVRLNFASKNTVYLKTLKIIERNFSIINNFLENYEQI